MPTTSFSHVLCHRKFIIIGVNKYFFARMTSCAERYDVIYHPFPINSQYLKMWGVDSPEDITQTIWSTKLEHTKTLASLKNNDSFSDSMLWDRLLKLEICYHKNLPKLKALRINRNISQRVKIQWKKKNEKKMEVAPPGFEHAPQLPQAQKVRPRYPWAMQPLYSTLFKINSFEIFFSAIHTIWTLWISCMYHEFKDTPEEK